MKEQQKVDVLASLASYVRAIDQLQEAKVVRSFNNPVADYAEWLVARTYGLALQTQSTAGYDAISSEGVRYEVKSRRLTGKGNNRRLSAIRNIEMKHFDMLAGVLFTHEFQIYRAALIPHDVIVNQAGFSKHTRSSYFYLRDSVWDISGVQDITHKIMETQNRFAVV